MPRYTTIQRDPVNAVQWDNHHKYPVETYTDDEVAADPALSACGVIRGVNDLKVNPSDYILTTDNGYSIVNKSDFLKIWELQ